MSWEKCTPDQSISEYLFNIRYYRYLFDKYVTRMLHQEGNLNMFFNKVVENDFMLLLFKMIETKHVASINDNIFCLCFGKIHVKNQYNIGWLAICKNTPVWQKVFRVRKHEVGPNLNLTVKSVHWIILQLYLYHIIYQL